MNGMQNYLFSFIEDMNIVAAQNAKKMEELIYEDPSSAITKARIFVEEVLKDVFVKEDISNPYVNTLSERINYLSRIGIFEGKVQKWFDTIRLSGNKAAHDGKFNDITEAFKVHRVMYDIAVWYFEVYSSNIGKRVPSYEYPKPKTNIQELDIQNLIKQQVRELLNQLNDDSKESDDKNEVNSEDHRGTKEIETENVIFEQLPEGQSYLWRELSKLQESSQEAVENADRFSQFKKYLHVERKIQKDLEDILEKNQSEEMPKLILLCGSVGDGKSHLLAYFKENKSDLIQSYEIYNDATESFSPEKNAMETLEIVLKEFSDQEIESTNKKVMIAINMGVLHNFINHSFNERTFERLSEFVKNSGLFSQNIVTKYDDGPFSIINFGDYHSFELTEEGPKSEFFQSLLEKIFSKSHHNPFYLAYKKDLENGIRTIIHENYEFLQDEFVRSQIVNLTIESLIKNKLVISARAFLNFVSDILIPNNVKNPLLTEFEKLEHSVPSLLFNNAERSPILRSMYHLDPLHKRSEHTDQLIVELNTLNDWEKIINYHVKSSVAKNWLQPFVVDGHLENYSLDTFVKSIIRTIFLTNKEFSNKIKDENFVNFTKNLYYFNVGNLEKIKNVYEEIKMAIFKWKGSPKNGYVYINRPDERYRFAQKLNLKPFVDEFEMKDDKVLFSFKSTISLGYHDGFKKNILYLDIDYPLYNLLMRVKNGYCPNKKDEEDAIRFVEFLDKAMEFGNKRSELLLHFPSDQRFYRLSKDDFGTFVFEKET